MTHLETAHKSELKEFKEKFNKKKYNIKSEFGKIISVETTDKEIIAYCKKLGLK